ncbi:hypothetical protein TGRUB_249520 [Toxoplasma gondii RUB]|uniref:Uncharacterized protein n=2 Tax=Toxoplasma gondii TaxID=5811 RepID=A0A086M5W9_TOXGO|nr:hypothetical protein TGRUB_249520 [Toxoplasma gondii RUB]KFH11981.1 hypothetical protein TGVAND_249520 [Toxoplasma gondii VAND]
MRITFCNIVCFAVYASGAFLLHDGIPSKAANVTDKRTTTQTMGDMLNERRLASSHRHTPGGFVDKTLHPKRSDKFVKMHFRSTERGAERSPAGEASRKETHKGTSASEDCAEEEKQIDAAEQKVQDARAQLEKHHREPAQKKAEHLQDRAKKISREAEEEEEAEEEAEEHHDSEAESNSQDVFLRTPRT